MLQTVEALIDDKGRIHLLEKPKIIAFHRALVTILTDKEGNHYESIVGSGEILDDDLESGSREIAEMFNRAIEKSAREVNDYKCRCL